ncbi:hypothetical protein [Klebsiella pneumoniae IS39]|nr:hypothetical protein [Klebsiella pneumoniae IS39]
MRMRDGFIGFSRKTPDGYDFAQGAIFFPADDVNCTAL